MSDWRDEEYPEKARELLKQIDDLMTQTGERRRILVDDGDEAGAALIARSIDGMARVHRLVWKWGRS